MPNKSSIIPEHIQLESQDAVWEWHTSSDRLFMSISALAQLRLEDKPPRSMKDYLEHCPLESLASILESMEKVLNGAHGPHLEAFYPFDNFLVRTQVLVLRRDLFGRATLVTGCSVAMDKERLAPGAAAAQSSTSQPPPRSLTEAVIPPTAQSDASRLMMALNAASDGLWDWDPSTNVIYFSPRYLSMLGYSSEEFPPLSTSWTSRVHPDDYDNIVPMQLEFINNPKMGDSFECTYRMQRGDGSWAWILSRGYVTHRDADGKAVRIVGLHTDVSASQGDRARLEELVRNDALTGLRSRTYYGMTVDKLEQQQMRPVSVIIADMDGLKMVNDHLGHPQGSEMLCQAAIILRNSLNATDCVARMGGDEFAAMVPGCAKEDLEALLQQVRDAFDAYNTDPEHVPTHMSVGGACAEDMNTTLAGALAEADRNMLAVKHESSPKWRLRIKSWIENRTGKTIPLEDSRYRIHPAQDDS